MLALLDLFSEKVLCQIFERSDLAELVFILGKPGQITHFIFTIISYLVLKHLEIVIKTVSCDYLAIFQYFMTDLFSFLEFDGSILSLQVPWVHPADPTPEIGDALLRNHIFVHQHVPVIVHDGDASECIIGAIDTYHFTI